MAVSAAAKRGEARNASPRRESGRHHEVLGVLLLAGGLLILLSLISFVPTDTGLFGTRLPDQRTHNWIGRAGATLAAGLFGLFGGAAYVLPLLMGMQGVRCFMDGPVSVTLRSAVASLFALGFFSALCHLEVTAVPTIASGWVQRGLAGGMLGSSLGEGLRHNFATTGAHIIVVAGFLVCLLLAIPITLTVMWQRARTAGASIRETVETLREALPERKKPASVSRPVKPKPVKINRLAQAVENPTPPPIEAEPEPVAVKSKEASKPLPEPTTDEDEALTVVPTTAPASVGYLLPIARELLSDPPGPTERMTDEMLKGQSDILTRALQSFGIEGKVTEVHPGPIVTMYEFEPAPGVKVARIVNLDNDLALALKAVSLRIVAPLPGKSVVGIEVPNLYRETVSFKEVLMSEPFHRSRSKLAIALGKDIFGKPVTADLRTMPHLLVAGATGAGKSVALNSMLLSILFSAKPDEVKLLLVDPKMLELQLYDGIPHLLRPVVTDAKSAARGLGWVVQEMERRYKLLAGEGVRNIDDYNRRVAQAQGTVPKKRGGAKTQQTSLEFLSEDERLSAGERTEPVTLSADGTLSAGLPATPPAPLPYIVVMIDELADLMMVAPKDVEEKIARLAQMARAAGIHLVLATQRPSVDVLTGLIKANFPARIAFQVSSKTDSRTILDANGAESLLGKGDMLYLASGTGRLTRVHGSFVADEDVRRVVEFVKQQASPTYSAELQSIKQEEAAEEEAKDEVYEQAKDLVLTSGQASASLIQRRLRVGYPRAARMIERMEEEGLVSAPARDGRREVLARRGPVGESETTV
jgi:S-DNA-T family DNA segregation ATPase FtsK/SpoIIIE